MENTYLETGRVVSPSSNIFPAGGSASGRRGGCSCPDRGMAANDKSSGFRVTRGFGLRPLPPSPPAPRGRGVGSEGRLRGCGTRWRSRTCSSGLSPRRKCSRSRLSAILAARLLSSVLSPRNVKSTIRATSWPTRAACDTGAAWVASSRSYLANGPTNRTKSEANFSRHRWHRVVIWACSSLFDGGLAGLPVGRAAM